MFLPRFWYVFDPQSICRGSLFKRREVNARALQLALGTAGLLWDNLRLSSQFGVVDRQFIKRH